MPPLPYGVKTEELTTFLEFDWTFNAYCVRFGRTFISIGAYDERSWPSLAEAQNALMSCGLCLAEKTDSRTWRVVAMR